MPNTRHLPDDLEPFLGTLAQLFAAEGRAREVAILTIAKSSIEETGYDNWNGGTYSYTIYAEVPAALYAQLAEERLNIEKLIQEKAADLLRLYPATWLGGFEIVPELNIDERWREKAAAWLSGKGITNQGRVRSDNIATRDCDGLLFRSQPEINLYKALKSLGVSFAPLPVFIKGGENYRRIEPDFVVFKDGVLMVVEVDGDTVHQETPVEAHSRTTMLVHEGAHVERVNTSECDTPQKARECATRLIGVLAKLKANK
jgi:hypothetical protein